MDIKIKKKELLRFVNSKNTELRPGFIIKGRDKNDVNIITDVELIEMSFVDTQIEKYITNADIKKIEAENPNPQDRFEYLTGILFKMGLLVD